ncbi:MAG: hypothetical protein ACRC5M_06835 [Anaeroplasmataceae bacterium]
MTIKEKIVDCVKNNRKFSIMINSYVFNDGFCYDVTSDPDMVRFIAKFNISSMTRNEPTFGSAFMNTGIQEIVIPYNQIECITILDVSPDLLAKFKEKYPEAYAALENSNKMDVVNMSTVLPY